MQIIDKKQVERYELEKFISNEELKFRVYNIKNSETPDFIVNIDKKLISIEHTRLINPKLKQVEAYREKIINLAQKKFNQKYNADLYVLITFKNIKLNGGKSSEQKYVDEVFNLVETIYLNNKNFNFSVQSKINKSVSESISHFSVYNTREMNHWQHFGAWKVDFIDKDWLKDIIKKKENNICKYTEKYTENWLLLVSNFGTKASSSRTDFIDFSDIESKFDKIFIHNFIADKVTIVK
ncbi:hypothetical protein JSO61_008635 [Riemerella anatipestifer]|uniref:hypothetical protein n=1 Tax=Riemerella anatipestifer TaxID=34085 RepID=UPI0030BEA1F1